jgi:hypothetical protein
MYDKNLLKQILEQRLEMAKLELKILDTITPGLESWSYKAINKRLEKFIQIPLDKVFGTTPLDTTNYKGNNYYSNVSVTFGKQEYQEGQYKLRFYNRDIVKPIYRGEPDQFGYQSRSQYSETNLDLHIGYWSSIEQMLETIEKIREARNQTIKNINNSLFNLDQILSDRLEFEKITNDYNKKLEGFGYPMSSLIKDLYPIRN